MAIYDIHNGDTISAISTPAGSGATFVLRISGGKSLQIAKKLTSNKTFTPNKAFVLPIKDGRDILDRAVITYFKNPKSFTGEDVVEFSCHGSSYIKRRLLELALELGARPAKEGEFSMRAFLNGKMDLARVQGLADLIASSNKAGHKAGMNLMEGKISDKFVEIKNALKDTLAEIEARIDDIDEEMPLIDTKVHKKSLTKTISTIQKLTDSFSTGKYIKEGIKTAIVGSPNSGKSSLLNALMGFDRAIVSEVSGTTRDTIEEIINVDGYNLILTDTAGIRKHALDPAEKEGIKRSNRAIAKSDLVLFVQDASKPVSRAVKPFLQDILKSGKNVIVVLNKADLTTKNNLKGIKISCKNGKGIKVLKNKILQTVIKKPVGGDVIITSARHYESLLKAREELYAAEELLGGRIIRLELFAEHIRGALSHLAEIVGEVVSDDILDIIFSKFCVGK